MARIRVVSPDGKTGSISEEKLTKALRNGFTLYEDKPETLAGKASALTKKFSPFPTSMSEATIPMSGIRQDAVTAPLKPLIGIEEAGMGIVDKASDILGNIPS